MTQETSQISQEIVSQQVKEATISEIQRRIAEAEIQGKYQCLQYFALKALKNLDVDVAAIIHKLKEADVEYCSLCSEQQVRTAFLIWFSFFIEQTMDSIVSCIEESPKNFRENLEYPPEPVHEPTEQELEDASSWFNSLQSPDEYAAEHNAEMNPELNPDRYADLAKLGLVTLPTNQVAEV